MGTHGRIKEMIKTESEDKWVDWNKLRPEEIIKDTKEEIRIKKEQIKSAPAKRRYLTEISLWICARIIIWITIFLAFNELNQGIQGGLLKGIAVLTMWFLVIYNIEKKIINPIEETILPKIKRHAEKKDKEMVNKNGKR